ncbi:MAG: hypothetical protein M4579_001662 [Chaenotheca gracillima]|nr:MAG: hypothetical protein M4579_001662 [Chaenotheca gracillima]
MDKLKNLLHPGKAEEDEILYGSGQSNDPVHSGQDGKIAGQGTRHTTFNENNSAQSDSPLSGSSVPVTSTSGSTAPTSSTTGGPHTSNVANRADPRVDSDRDGSRNVGLASTTAGQTASNETTRKPVASGTTQPQYSNTSPTTDTNKPLPRTPATGTAGTTQTTNPSSTAGYGQSGYGQSGQGQSGYGQTGYGQSTTDPTTSNTTSNLGRDATLGTAAGVGAGAAAHHHNQQQQNQEAYPPRTQGDGSGSVGPSSTTTARTFPLASGSASYGSQPQTSNTSSAGPHSSGMANRADPRVDSDLDGSRNAGLASGRTGTTGTTGTAGTSGTAGPMSTTQSSHPGRTEAETAAGAAWAGSSAGHQHDRGTHASSNTGPGGPTSTTNSAGLGGPTSSTYSNTNPSGATEGSYYGGPRGTAVGGPHPTFVANMLDPALHGDESHERPASGVGPHQHDVVDRTVTGAGATGGASRGVGAATGSIPTTGQTSSTTGPAGYSAGTTNTGSTGTGYPSGATSTGSTTRDYPSGTTSSINDQPTGMPGGFPTGTNEPSTTSTSRRVEEPTSTSHTGRDVAVGGGGAAAAAAASWEASKHPSHDESTTSSSPSSGTAGPHKSSLLNKLDPRVKNTPTKQTTRDADASSSPSSSSPYSASQIDPRVDSVPRTSTEPQSEHHYGRDAGIVGGAGAVGAGAYEADKRHQGTTPATTQKSTTTGTDPSTTPGQTAGPHSSTLLNKADPRYDSGDGHRITRDEPPHSGTKDTHYGRDAAVVGGAGALGGGAYEAEKHRGTQQPTSSTTRTTDPSTTPGQTAGPHSSTLLNKADPRYDSSDGHRITRDAPPHSGTRDTQYGRDAAVVGGTGAAGTGAYDAEKHRGTQQPTSSTTGGTTTQPRSFALGTTDPNAETTRTGEHRDQHHYGRDAAVVGGAGALGTGAYEAEKHRGAQQPTTSTTGTTGTTGTRGATTTAGPYDSNIANKADPRVDSDRSRTTGATDQKDHHYGRDAAVVGGAGAVGTGAYEAERRHGAQQPTSSTTGTRGATTTAGPYDSNVANKADPRVDSDRSRTTGTTDQQKDHHYGRDAAVVGGAGAAAAGADYELNQKEQEKHAKELEKEQKQHAKEAEKQHKHDQKEADKQHKHDQKEADKQHKHDVKEAEKEHKKAEKEAEKHQKHAAVVAEKQHEKEAKEEQKHHEKEAALAEKQHEKEAKEAEKHDGKEKKHHGLFSFLHRDKDKKYTDEEEEEFARQEREHHAASQAQGEGQTNPPYTAIGQEGSTSSPTGSHGGHPGTTAAAYPEQFDPNQDRNKLHKQPPPKYAEKLGRTSAELEQGGTGSSGSQSYPADAGTGSALK